MNENPETAELDESLIGEIEQELGDDFHAVIPPDLVKFLHQIPSEDLLVDMDGSKTDESGGIIGFVKEWFSPQDDYRADTYITPQQVRYLAILRNLSKIYPEMAEFQPAINGIIEDFERYAISIDGFARKQEENVLRSLAGDNSQMAPSDRDSMILSLLSNPPQEGE